MPAITVARNVNLTPANFAGHLITPLRRPVNEIHVPLLAPEHGTIAVERQQPTTRARRRSCSRTLAASGLPARSSTTIVYRHGVLATGCVEDVDNVARKELAAATEPAKANIARSAKKTSRTSLILGMRATDSACGRSIEPYG